MKLGWVNNQHMRMKDLDELSKLAVPFFQQQGHVGENVSEKEYEVYMADPVHPTQAGYLEWWTPKMEEYLYQFLER